jgi:hypothetical protein
MIQLYSQVAANPVETLRLYKAGKLKQLYNSLDRLEYVLCDTKDLLGACTKDPIRTALVVSIPMPPPEKQMSSKFDLLVAELMWNLDLIEYALYPTEDKMLQWCSDLHRYVLKRISGSSQAMIESVKMESVETEPVGRRLACLDRQDLQSDLENGSFFVPVSTMNGNFLNVKSLRMSICQYFLCNTSRFNPLEPPDHLTKMEDILIKRCKVKLDPQSAVVDPECFKIDDHLDLQPTKLLGEGGFKKTYQGVWCGQQVVISTLKNVDLEDLEMEVKHLLRLQHPKVVSFFGWAFTNDAPVPVKSTLEDKKCAGGYIVTEKMEGDLGDLIERTQKAATKLRDSGGPFSHSVGLDILLQIVEAVLHMHNLGVVHRDLKPKNVLVNCRSSPTRFDADAYYDVKLTDFGGSKILESGDKGQTYNKGTGRYGAPEMMVGADRGGCDRGDYDPCGLDAFGFAMTCYEVFTGLEPFYDIQRGVVRAVREKLRIGERPEIPRTVLLRPGLKELMEDCWAFNPASRPKFEEIQEVPSN